jgi:UDP-N-acetyl-D-mannosaminuronic acid transferase (WecB/TagA/CpsF family)
MLMVAGAMFDFITRAVRRGSHWVSRRRLDCLFHLRKESRRLCQQYATEIVRFLVMILAQRLGRRSVL